MAPGRPSRALRRGLALRCPRCGRSPIFDGWFRMRPRCATCGLPFEREAGYFVGAIYINYGVTVGLLLAGYFALEAWLAPPAAWQVALWGAFAVVFPLWSFRYSKGLWLALDHLVDPPDAGPSPPAAAGRPPP